MSSVNRSGVEIFFAGSGAGCEVLTWCNGLGVDRSGSQPSLAMGVTGGVRLDTEVGVCSGRSLPFGPVLSDNGIGEPGGVMLLRVRRNEKIAFSRVGGLETPIERVEKATRLNHADNENAKNPGAKAGFQ